MALQWETKADPREPEPDLVQEVARPMGLMGAAEEEPKVMYVAEVTDPATGETTEHQVHEAAGRWWASGIMWTDDQWRKALGVPADQPVEPGFLTQEDAMTVVEERAAELANQAAWAQVLKKVPPSDSLIQSMTNPANGGI
jgi:hypothetical protein